MFAAKLQAEAFLMAMYAGLLSGVLYDFLQLLRLALRAGKIITALTDILFWILAAALTGIAAALSGVEGLRFYLVLGTLSGLLLWAAGFSRVIRRIVSAVLGLFPKEREGKNEQGGEIARKRGKEP